MNTENLSKTEAKKKFTKLVDDIKICMMITNFSKKPLSVVPMSAKKVDKAGNILFLTGNDSDHFQHIREDSACQLVFSDAKSNFLSVYGEAKITEDQTLINELYSSKDNAYFEGKEDSRLVAIQFIPEQAVYWSTEENRIISLFKLGLAAISENNQDLRKKGKIDF